MTGKAADLSRFAELVSRDQFDLLEASLLVACDAYPALDVAAYTARVDAIAERIRGRLAADAFAEQRVAALNHCLYDELGFAGDVATYYDPRNSYLNEVIERRIGIPITLAVLYMELGRRIGLAIQGVSFPGHFLVKLKVKRGHLVLDPFSRGAPQGEAELRRRLARALPDAGAERVDLDTHLRAASAQQILARMLRNLKAIHLKSERPEAALPVMNRMLLVAPDALTELRDRGLLYERLECSRPALADLQNYLRRAPEAPDAALVREKVVALTKAVGRLN